MYSITFCIYCYCGRMQF